MSELDQFSSDLVKKYQTTSPEAMPGLDQFSKDLISKTIERAKGEVDPKDLVLDTVRDWDFPREAIDAATFGALSKASPQHIQDAQKAWRTEHSGQAAFAQVLGQTAPEMAASTLLGQGEVALAGKLAKLPELAKFLTGSSEGNALMRLGSQATWGAQQGLVTAGMENAFGRDADPAGAAIAGGMMGPLDNILFSPLHSSISPQVAKFAQDYMKATGAKLNLSQIPGAPYAARAMARVMGMGRKDLPGLTSSVMRSTGSTDKLATDQTLALARSGIKQRLEQAIPSSQATKLNDDQMSNLFDQLGNVYATAKSPQADAVRLAQNQWINSRKIERMMSSSGRVDGLLDPDAVASEIKSQTVGYPGGGNASAAASAAGNPVDLGLLGRGADLFSSQGAGGPHISPGAGFGLGAGLAAGHEFIEPLLEHFLPVAPIALGAGAAYSAIGATMDNPVYRNLLLRAGGRLGPIGDPLIPTAAEWKGNEMSPVTPAKASEVDPYTSRLFQIESNNNRFAKTGNNMGLGQFSSDQFKHYGITDWTDAGQQASAVAKERAEQAAIFQDKFNRAPTQGESYLMHQQGNSGGPALLAGGDTPAWQVLRQFYGSDKAAQRAISSNLPSESGLDAKSVSAKDFSNFWINKFEGGQNGPLHVTIPLSPANALASGTSPDQVNELLGSQ